MLPTTQSPENPKAADPVSSGSCGTNQDRSRLPAHLHGILSRIFRLQQLRPGQWEVMENVLRGEDTLAIMPTGAGKSLCYQLPALELPGQTLVVSPLIALMRDQTFKLGQVGVPATQLNSTLGARAEDAAMQSIRKGQSEFIFTTPEHLGDEAFMAMLAGKKIDLFVIDEAHCISQWGHDFRPAFLEIRRAVERLGNPPILALTATATPEIIADIQAQLGRPDMRVLNTGIYRPNLRFAVKSVTNEREKHETLLAAVTRHEGAGIVYAATVKAAEETHLMLREAGVDAALYHGRLAAAERRKNQDAFMSGTSRVMVATNAFGLGIDKRDIRFVIHYQIPPAPESYYQEAGRAGRDGFPADCLLIYDSRDKRVHQFFMIGRYPTVQEVIAIHQALTEAPGNALTLDGLQSALARRHVVARSKLRVVMNLLMDEGIALQGQGGTYRAGRQVTTEELAHLAEEYGERDVRDRARLERMVFYAQTGFCRWKVLLEYFEEPVEWSHCGSCDNCLRPKERDLIIRPHRRVPPPLRASALAFDVGALVSVPKYGEGRVVRIGSDGVSVEFPDGQRRRFIPSVVTAAANAEAHP